MRLSLRIRAGIVVFLLAASSPLRAQTFIWNGSANNNWFNQTNWTPQGVPTAGSSVLITNGSPTLTNAPATVSNLTVTAGSLTIGTGGLNVTSNGLWSGGTISGLLTNSGTLVLSGGNMLLTSAKLINLGNVLWESGTLQGSASTVFSNAGTVTITASNANFNNNGGGTPVFFDAVGASLSVFATNGSAFFQGTAFSNLDVTSAVNVELGTLQLSGGGLLAGQFNVASNGSILLSAGSFVATNTTLNGPGMAKLSGGSLLLTGGSSPDLLLAGGTVTLGPAFESGGDITNLTLSGSLLSGNYNLAGVLNWQAGNISGSLNILPTGTLYISGAGTVIQYAAVTNAGQIVWNGSGNWGLYDDNGVNPGHLVNLASGSILIQSDNTLAQSDGNDYAWINNAGSIVKSASPGASTIQAVLTNTGTIAVETGTLYFNDAIADNLGGSFQVANGAGLNFQVGGVISGAYNSGYNSTIDFQNTSSGALTATGPIAFTGSGLSEFANGVLNLYNGPAPGLTLVGGTVNFPAGYTSGLVTNLTLTFPGETLAGSNYVTGVFNLDGTTTGPLVIAPGGVVNWTGGNINGGLLVMNGGTFNISAPTSGTAPILGAMTNYGVVNWTNGNLYFSNAYNMPGGQFNIQCDDVMFFINDGVSFYNSGVVQKSVTQGTTTVEVNFVNTGSVIVQSGSMAFDAYDDSYAGLNSMFGGNFLVGSGAMISLDSGGVLSGTFTTQPGGAVQLESGIFTPTPSLVFNGTGSSVMTGGTFTLTNTAPTNLNVTGGNIYLSPGFQGGTITNLSLNASLFGTNIVTGTLNLGGNIEGPITVVSNAVLNVYGNILGPITLMPGAILNWSNGYLQTPLTIPTNASVNLVGGASSFVSFNGFPVTNNGTLNWASGELYIIGAATYNEPGGVFYLNSATEGYGSGTVFNAGLMEKTTANFSVAYWNFNNAALLDVQAGTLEIGDSIQSSQQNGTYQVEAGSVLELAGGGYLDGTFNAAAGASIQLTSGSISNTATTSLNGPGAIQLVGATFFPLNDLPPNLNLISGNLNPGPNFQGGSITALNLGAVNLVGSNYVTGILELTGTVEGPLTVGNGGSVILGGSCNGGTAAPVALLAGSTMSIVASNGEFVSPVTIQPGASLNFAVPAGSIFTIYDYPMTNYGTINWLGGELEMGYTQIYNQAGSQFNVLCDSLFANYGSTSELVNYGTVRKTGTYGTNTLNVYFSNFGTLEADGGTLAFNSGSFTQSGGIWNIGLLGNSATGQGSNAMISVSSAAPLPATLNVLYATNFALTPGAKFNLVSFPSATGAIGATNLPAVNAAWQLNQSATNLTLLMASQSAPTVSLSAPVNGSYLVAPNSLNLTVAVTPASAPVAAVQYLTNGNLLAQVTSAPFSYNWSPVAPGQFAIVAEALDSAGALGASAPVNITVVSAGPQPTNYTWIGTNSSDWFNATNWSPTGVPGALDTANLANGEVAALSHNASVANVNLSSGTIGGPGVLSVTNQFLFTGGNLTNTLLIPTNASLVINTPHLGSIGLSGATILNQGTARWESGTIVGTSNTVVSNSGVWLAETSSAMQLGVTGTNYGLFVNDGIYRNLAIPGGVAAPGSILVMNFTNNGLVDAEAGSISFGSGQTIAGAYNTASNALIQFYQGNDILDAAPVITGSGGVQFIASSIYSLTAAHDIPSALSLMGGTILLGPSFQNNGAITNLVLAGASLPGTNTVTGTLQCYNNTVLGGPAGGSLTVAASGTLVFGTTNTQFSGSVQLENLSLVNQGEMISTGGAVYDLDGVVDTSTVTNNNLWIITGQRSCSLQNFSFVNNGILRSFSSLTVNVSPGNLINNGEIDVETSTLNVDANANFAGNLNAAVGATLVFTGGSNNVASPPNLTGGGNFQITGGTLVLSSDVVAGLQLDGGATIILGPHFQNNGAINDLTLNGAQLVGNYTVTGALNILGSSSLVGSLTINAGATLLVSNASFSMNSGSLTNNGSVVAAGSSTYFIFDSSPAGYVVNNGLWLDQTSFSEYESGSPPNNTPFINNGTYTKTGSSSTFISQPLVNNGLFNVEAAQVYLDYLYGENFAGNFNVTPGAWLYLYEGNYTVGTTAPVITGGGFAELINPASLSLSVDQVPNLILAGGNVVLGPSFQNKGSITNLTLGGATLVGTNTVSGSLLVTNDTTLSNLTVLSNGVLTIGGNQPLYMDQTGSVLVNNGVVDWTGGVIYTTGTAVITNNGLWLIESDSTLESLTASTRLTDFVNNGDVTKTTTSGTTLFYGISFLNAGGTLAVNSGTVNLSANEYDQYAQTGATLSFGASAANSYGKLLLTTNVTLDGTFNLTALNGYSPGVGDSFSLITYPSIAGTFSNLTLPQAPTGSAWAVQYGSNALELAVSPDLTNVPGFNISGSVMDSGGHVPSGAIVYATQMGGSNLVQNGSFEIPQFTASSPTGFNVGSTNISNWLVIGPAADTVAIHNNYLGPPEDGNQYFDPTGGSGGAGITQTFPTVPGATYELVFYHGSQQHYGSDAVLGIAIGTNYFTEGETDGQSGNLDWRRVEYLFTASGTNTTLTFMDLNGFNADNNFVDNVQVYAPGAGSAFQGVVNANGSYSLTVPNGNYEVGVMGLPAAGYNTVTPVTATAANNVVNFQPTPSSSGQFFTIATGVSAAGLGTVSGGGTNLQPGSVVTVTATQISNALPYYFAGWTENGVLESTNLAYTFTVLRSRNLVADFQLPGYLVSVSDNPTNAGEISGEGVFIYNSTNVLTAYPTLGYNFLNWSQGSTVISAANPLSTVITSNFSVTANFTAANPTHVVSVTTLPVANLATAKGTGTYTNGQTAVLTVPSVVTNSGSLYLFNELMLNGVVVSTAPSFTKTFSTLDPTNEPFLAVYTQYPITPKIVSVSDNFPNPVPATANFVLTFQFDRAMSTTPAPLVVLTNSAPGAVQPVVQGTGLWSSTVFLNDTYQTRPITFGAGMDGTVQVLISRAQDTYGHALPVTSATSLTVQSTPPPAPVVTLVSPTNGQIFSTSSSTPFVATAMATTNAIAAVNFYENNLLVGSVTTPPYQFTLGALAPGSYGAYAVAVDTGGGMGTSMVAHITVNVPGTTLTDFEALTNAATSPVSGLALSNYLWGNGVGLSNVGPSGASLMVVDGQTYLGGTAVQAASGVNVLAEAGSGGAVTYTLYFTNGLDAVGWVRAEILAGTAGAALPGWRAQALDNQGQVVGSVGEAATASYNNIPAAPFTLAGSNIWAVQFTGNSGGAGALATLPLDNLLLSTVPLNTTLTVGLGAGAGTVLSAPGTIVLQAAVNDSLGVVTNVQFFEGTNLAASVVPSGGVAAVTLRNLAAGSYSFTAVASDSVGASRSSAALGLTVAGSAGVTVVDFDSLDTSAGSVGGTALSNYLAGYGLVASNVTVGTVLEAVRPGLVTAAGGAVAVSPPNYLTQEGLNTPVSFTLVLTTPVPSFGFSRAGLVAGSGGVSHPQWVATAYAADGTELGQAGEALIQSATNVAARNFLLTGLTGEPIQRVRFDSDSQKVAGFSAVLLDDLVMDSSVVAGPLAVTVLPPVVSTPAPATIPLAANVSDTLSTNYTVSYFSGPNLIGTVSNAPYIFDWSNVLAGHYQVRAEVVDAGGQAAFSSAVTVPVLAGGASQVVNFDSLNATTGPVTGIALSNYLAGYGTMSSNSPGTQLAVANQTLIGGGEVAAPSPPNVITQLGSNGPVNYTISFNPKLAQFGFTRSGLLASPFVSHPAWTATALDAAGVAVAEVGEPAMGSYTNVGASAFSLSGPGIASVQFASQGTGLQTFNAIVADDFVLTTNLGPAPFPPAVALTAPVSGLQVVGVSALTVSATALDDAGVTGVAFYANGQFIGSALAAPYSVQWTNSGPGGYSLTAVATNTAGLTRTSPPVAVSILPAAYQFGIVTEPASQVVATGGAVTLSVVASGTNTLTYQWKQNGQTLQNQTNSTLTLNPVTAGDAGTYTVQVTGGSTILTSAAAVLEVLDPPLFTQQPASVSALAGSNIVLTETVNGDGPLTWQWLLNGTSIAGATNAKYALPGAQPLSSGNYQVVVANAAAYSVSQIARVAVQAGNGQVESAPDFADRIPINPLLGAVAGNTVASPATGELAQVAGKPAGNFIWYTWQCGFTGVISLTTLGSDFDTLLGVYTGSNVSQLTPVAQDDDSGGFFTSEVTFNVSAGTTYQIAVAGYRGAAGNVVLGLPGGTGYRVLAPGQSSSVPVITQQPASQLVSVGASVNLSVQATGAQTYQWYFQGQPVGAGGTGSTLSLPDFQPNEVGLYSVLVANAAGSVSSQAASLQAAVINQNGVTNAAHDKFGDAVDLAGTYNGPPPQTQGAGGGDTRGYSVAQTFSTVGATKEADEPNHCGQTGGASQWYIYTAPAAGTLHVSTAGSSFNTILAVYTGPATNFAGLTPVACGYTTNFQSNGQPSLVIPGVVSGTRYYVVVDGYLGASGKAQLQIGLGSAPTLVSPPASQYVTGGGKVTFTARAVGSTNLSYQWQLNGANLPGATASTLIISNASPADEGSYTIVVSNVIGVITSAPPALLVVQSQPHVVSSPTNETVVLGKKAQFSVAASGVNTKTDPFTYQWYFDGQPKAGATAATLVLTAAQWTNQGTYQVVVSNSFGSDQSAPAVLTVSDTIPPVVAITSPPAGKVLTVQTNFFTVTGSASDAAGVAAVYIKVNTNNYQPAHGSNAWSLGVSLIPGTNLITAQAVDLAGNTNHILVQRSIIYLVSSPLTLLTNGVGSITSTTGATNGALLIVGRNYSVAAAPIARSGWLFADWTNPATETDLGAANPLTFAMSSNLVLEAVFVTNPFPAVAGTYNGLFYPSNGVTAASSGFLTATLLEGGSGAYTAQLMLDGKSYQNKAGLLSANGQGQWLVTRAGLTPVTVNLDLHLNPADGQITGSVSNVSWFSLLQADLAPFNPGTDPATNYNGQYTLIFPPAIGAPVSAPGGFGYAVLTNTLGGQSTVVGVLGDGTPFTQSVGLAADGSIPLYASLYGGNGSLLGWITFTNQPPKTVTGNVNWIKPAQAKTLYPEGFNLQMTNLPGSSYTNANLNNGPILALPNDAGTLTLSNGSLATPLIYNLTVGPSGQLTNPAAGNPTNLLTLGVTPANGVLKLNLRLSGSKTNTFGWGAILQNQTNILGGFLGTNQSGAVIAK